MTIPISPDPPPNFPLPDPAKKPDDPPVHIIDLPPNSPSPGIIVPDPKLPPS
jgi:hypothetical protein